MLEPDYLEAYLDIIRTKYDLRNKESPKRNNHELYLDGLLDEVREVRDEIKPDNHVYLEDELGDIFRDYLNLLFHLREAGYIRSIDDVFARSITKYRQRVDGRINGTERKITKQHQQKALATEHEESYPTTDAE